MHYGRLCERCFSETLSADAPFSFFPQTISGVQTTDQQVKQLSDYADPVQLAKATKAAERLRQALLSESNDKGSLITPQTTQKFNEFLKGLAQGSEAMLSENPFYELTVLIYQLNLKAIENAFVESQKGADHNLPQAMKVSRSLKYIWGREGSMIPLGVKIQETLGKTLSLGKILLGLILFIGSTLTTAKGVNDLVQLDGFVRVFGDFFLGEKHENIRLLLTLTVGVVLSSIILDFKDRLFQGVAETGKVFQGFVDAFKRFPRWMFLSMFFSMASIWTNYDGIVLLFSKTQDLSYQSEVIQDRVGRALGDPEEVDPDNPDSLTDLKGLLETKVATSIEQFNQVVEDEMLGVASSGIASKGPRYWSKYYIIHGGYKPGSQDVVSEIGRSKFNRKLDVMLQRSKLDFSRSLEQKLEDILQRYNGQFEQMSVTVKEQMDDLTDKMTLSTYSIDELTALFNLEAYHVNRSVQEVVGLLEKNKGAFGQAAEEINRLAEDHINFLREVDRVGIPTNTQYTINVRIDIPPVEAIDQLNQSQIPMAKRRSVMELKALLHERYGSFVGASILFGILFIAVFMDLSDPIFYSTMVARWGRRDRHFLQENIKRFQVWEEEYIQNIRTFLARPDVRAILPQLSCPRTPVLHWIYHQYLESLAPFVKDYARLNARERFRFWFLGLFSTTRIRYAEVYNARQSVTRRILKDSGTLLPPLLNHLYGNLFHPFSIGNDHFDTLYERVNQKMIGNEDRFTQEIARISTIIDEQMALSPEQSSLTRSRKLHHKVLAKLHTGHGVINLLSKKGRFYELLYLIFSRPIGRSEFDFSLTRNNWMVDQALFQKISHSYISSLLPFVPVLTKLLGETIPQVKRTLLYPVMESLENIPHHVELKRILKIQEAHDECLDFERELLCVLGMSHGQGLQVDNALFRSIMENAVCEEIPAVFLTKEKEADVLALKMARLESGLSKTLAIITRLLAERKQTISTLTKIRIDSLRPISSILDKFNNRDLIEGAVGLYTLHRELAALDGFIMRLWGGGRVSGNVMSPDGAEEERADLGGGVDLVLAKFNLEGQGEDFSLLTMALELEKKLATMKKEVESKVFLLTFLDKTIDKTKAMISDAFQLIATIFIHEARLTKSGETLDKADRERLEFLEDHYLFLQSVPLFLDANRTQLMASAKVTDFVRSGEVESLRVLEGQIFKIHTFLENTESFLDGKRGRAGIVAPLDLMEDLPLLPAKDKR
ncbi:MAG: hypothetical protein HQL72_11025 [Magnetococcales bacterium]|nr:hypothetical protein [Magnetococcales bacterium]